MITSVSSGVLSIRTFPVPVYDFCEVNRFDIVPAVGDGRIGCVQFHVGDAVGDAAQSQRKVCVRVNIAVSVCVRSVAVSQSCESEIVQVFKTEFRCDFFQAFYRDDIDGVLNRLPNGGFTAVTAVGITDGSSIGIIVRFILEGGGQSHAFFIQCRRVSG